MLKTKILTLKTLRNASVESSKGVILRTTGPKPSTPAAAMKVIEILQTSHFFIKKKVRLPVYMSLAEMVILTCITGS